MSCQCSVCGVAFEARYAYQVAALGPGSEPDRLYFCSLDCRKNGLGRVAFQRKRARRIAVLNQKGGTGKTTTAVNVAAGLAERGSNVLLVDCDSQGNVGISLGLRGEKSLYHLLVEGLPVDDVVVPIRSNLDIITSDATLAAAEVWLARCDDGRDNVMGERLEPATRQRDYILLDCGPSLSLLNQNALKFADEVIIPVSCDYLSLVGVKQVLRTLKDVDRLLGHGVRITGVVPTFYDGRVKLAKEALDTLREHFKEKLFDPVRRSTRLAEAPSHRQTIFEYAPDSNGADDYRKIVERVIQAGAVSQPGARPAARTTTQAPARSAAAAQEAE